MELGQPAAKQDIATLQLAAKSEAAASMLADLGKKYEEEVLLKRLSCIDLLEMYPEIDLPFAKFLRMLPPMRGPTILYFVVASREPGARHAYR